jgi:hypothetical protein
MPISPTIRLTFRGILLLRVDTENNYCDVGFLREPPADHVLTIDLTQRTATGSSHLIKQLNADNISDRLRLDVENVSRPGIHLFQQLGFDRKQLLGDRNDFRWAVNFQTDLFGGESPGLNTSGFRSILRIDNGTFFTENISRDELIVRKDGTDTALGRVATAVGAQISLDREDSSAVFVNGETEIFEYRPEPGINYEINISQSPLPPITNPIPTEADANAYLTVVEPPAGSASIEFRLPPSPVPSSLTLPVSQHAVCFTGVVRTGSG